MNILRKTVCFGIILGVITSLYPAALGAAYRTIDRVNLRTGASLDASVIRTLNRGVTVEVMEYGEWSKAEVNGTTGYIKSEYLEEIVAAQPAPETAEDAAPTVYKTTDRVNFRTGASLDASVIKTLNPGVSVETLEYDADNWSKVNVGGTVGFIKSEYLIDAESYTGAVSPTGVELLGWSEVKPMIPLHTRLQITDVRSGTVYYIQCFSKGLHADVEPSSTEDTSLMKKTFGGAWKWSPRPVWVTFNGRTFAASINGMPHGGGVVSNNGMNGQVCLHFQDSRTHNGGKTHERDHQACVKEAWNAAQ